MPPPARLRDVSIKLMTLAWDLRLQPTTKLVLLAMCDWANDAGICFPSIPTVAHKTSISSRHCQRIMAGLIENGLIVVVGNPQGGIGSRRYQVNVVALREGRLMSTGDKLSPVDSAAPLPVPSASETGDVGVTRTNTNRQSDPPLPAKVRSTIDWTYLRQLSEQERVVVVDMLIGTAESQHQGIVDELAGALRAKAIKTQWPAWLRSVIRRAQSGAFVANHALAVQRDRQRAAKEAKNAEERRAEEDRRRDPEARERGLAAMKAAIAAINSSTKKEGPSS